MASIGEVKKKLPIDFVNWLYEYYGSSLGDKIISGMGEKRYTTLRVNNLKMNIQDLMRYFKELNIKFERINWYQDALILKNADEKDIMNLDIFKNGNIYMQSLSSMIPPIILEPQKGQDILDLTAAPGSKTTQIASMINNQGYILANEYNKIRAEKLKHNVEIQSTSIVDVNIGKGEKVGDLYPEKFDKVLVDAPCSGEGRFLYYNRNTYSSWSLKDIKILSEIQKKLIESGYKALKSGGNLVYSTCTINECENEEVVEWAIKNLKLSLCDININIGNKNIINNSKNMLKVMPSKEMEGFFVCKFFKK